MLHYREVTELLVMICAMEAVPEAEAHVQVSIHHLKPRMSLGSCMIS